MKSKFSGSLKIKASEANFGNLESEMGTEAWGAGTAPKGGYGCQQN